jgi:hypothetical protein
MVGVYPLEVDGDGHAVGEAEGGAGIGRRVLDLAPARDAVHGPCGAAVGGGPARTNLPFTGACVHGCVTDEQRRAPLARRPSRFDQPFAHGNRRRGLRLCAIAICTSLQRVLTLWILTSESRVNWSKATFFATSSSYRSLNSS